MMGGMDEERGNDSGDPLTPAQRAHVDQVLAQLAEDDLIFVCGVCHSFVDVRFISAHAASHDPV